MKFYKIIIVGLLFIASCNKETTRMNNYLIHGIDVSHHQSYINWEEVSKNDIHFAFLKATEGVSLVDSLYCENWEELSNTILKKGAYHFFRPTVPAQQQFENFSMMVHLDFGDLPPVLDIEVSDGVKKEELVNNCKKWLQLVENKYQVRPIIYTNLKFYHKYLAGHFAQYPIWIARYNDKLPELDKGKNWDFWQYGNRGKMKGIEGYVDFNVFNGTYENLESLCKQDLSVKTLSIR
ncbi:MAG: GH25 family lysozyme [Saprospiraceae bacterium]